MPRGADGPSRYGFVVSRRIGNAVSRNRVRRRLRAIVRGHLDQLAMGYDVVVIARPGTAEVSHTALDDAMLDLLRLARLMPDLPEVS
jgi:ribonuclease P protein component